MDFLSAIIGVLGGGFLTSVASLPFIVKKTRADAKSADLDNEDKAISVWVKIAEERQDEARELHQRIHVLEEKIDKLYNDQSNWRDQCNKLIEEKNRLTRQLDNNAIKLCKRRRCEQRDPPSDF